MMLHKQLSISVVIVARDHEDKITYLLRSVLKQNLHDYILDRIIVVCDGSSDHTPAKVSRYANKYPQITFLYYADALGTNTRIENVVSTLTSDVILLVEPNIVLKGTNFIRDILTRFYAERIVMVIPSTQISDGTGIKNYINKQIFSVRDKFARITRDSHLIYSLNLDAVAVRKNFIKGMIFPSDINRTIYLYFSALYSNNHVIPCDSASIIKTYPDLINSLTDLTKIKVSFKQIFGDLVEREVNLSVWKKIFIFFSLLTYKPLSILIFNIVVLVNFIGKFSNNLLSVMKTTRGNDILKRRVPSY